MTSPLTYERQLLQETNEALRAQIAERVTERRSGETLIKTFYRHSPECHAVLIETTSGRFEFEEINPATLALYGKTRDQVVGKPLEAVLDPDQATAVAGHLRMCLQTGLPQRYERRHGERLLEAIASPVPDSRAGRHRIVVSARDVTERQRLEQELQQSKKMEAIGQLTSGVAHDFNNLLASIIAALEVMQTRIDQGRIEDLGRYVLSAYGAATRAARMTHQLLAFSRRQTLECTAIDVAQLVRDNEEPVRRILGPKITLTITTEAPIWNVMADAHQLEIALLNLCTNAHDAMPHGGNLTISTANHDLDEHARQQLGLPGGEYLALCVSDTGPGMSPLVASRAFDPFFTTKPMGEGTGLGLSMIHGFAKQSGGTASIRSQPEQGATVCIYLPRYLGEVTANAPAHRSDQACVANGHQTVLFVDDEAPLRTLAIEVLAESGYTPVEAVDGVSALSILESTRPIDLLVTDIGLPGGINGRQLADAARALRPGLKVLFVTGYADQTAIGPSCANAGYSVLKKPFRMETLMGVVHDIIDHPALAGRPASLPGLATVP